MNLLRVKHKLTAYHWRHDRRGRTQLAICSCGWRCRLFRVRKHWLRPVCIAIGHKWDAPYVVDVGPAGFKKPDYTYSVWMCARCLTTRSAT